MYSIQEQEERDYWPQTELQNAYAQSQIEFQDDSALIESLRRAGRFVVVLEVPAYCPRTDASLGYHRSVLSDWDNLDDARAAVNGEEQHPEEFVDILAPIRQNNYVPLTDSDIPF